MLLIELDITKFKRNICNMIHDERRELKKDSSTITSFFIVSLSIISSSIDDKWQHRFFESKTLPIPETYTSNTV